MIADGVLRDDDLDRWLARPALRVAHAREADIDANSLWAAARAVRLKDAGLLGRLIRWRIPGTPAPLSFEDLFSSRPFIVLQRGSHALVSGLVGRIWTLRRDYPALSDPEEFRDWSRSGTARVLFAHWVEPVDGGARLSSEVRVQAFGLQGRMGVAAVRPMIRAFHELIASDGLEAAVRQAAARDTIRS
jgi:hypothetical protein